MNKLLSLNVYRTSYEMLDKGRLSDCTNGGVTAKAWTIYVAHPQGHIDASTVDAKLIFTPEQRGPNYWALIPAFAAKSDKVIGPMSGGNLAYTCDSRGGGIVYHVHDRFETQADYDALSR